VLHDDWRVGFDHRGQFVIRRVPLDRWNEALQHRPGTSEGIEHAPRRCRDVEV
jgi:hypothetical protein